MKRILIVLIAVLTLPMASLADDFYVQGDMTSWDSGTLGDAAKMTFDGSNIYTWSWTPTTTGDYYLRILGKASNGWYSNGLGATSNGANLTTSPQQCYWTSNNGWKITVTAGKTYILVLDANAYTESGDKSSYSLRYKEDPAPTSLASASVVISTTKDFAEKVELPMLAALYRSDADDLTHTADDYRFQLGVKKDFIEEKVGKATTYYWYIKDNNGTEYRPTWSTSIYNMPNSSGSNYKGFDRVEWESYDNCNGSNYTTNCFSFTNDGVSYTFQLSNKAWTGYNRYKFEYGTAPSVQFWKNKSSITDDANGWYVVGNFDENGEVDAKGSWNIDYAKKMDKITYNDSTVYQVVVPQPSAGFSDIFFGFVNGTDKANWTGATTDWDKVYRPEIHDNRDCDAMESTLFSYYYDVNQNGDQNQNMAVNPILNENQQKANYYILRLNVTTSTYCIYFVNGMYIAGDAVDGSPKEMTYDNKGKYYSANVTMTPGKTFYFYEVKNSNPVKYYGEDDDVPAADGEMAPTVEYRDTPFMNHVKESATADITKCTFTLPSRKAGTYDTYTCEVRLYPASFNSKFDKNDAHSGEWFYTYDRPIRMTTKQGVGASWAAWANNYPMQFTETSVPTVYTVKYKTKSNTVTLDNNLDYVPAKTGVLLMNSDNANYSGTGTAKSDIRARVYVEKLDEAYSDDANKLVPIYLNTDDNRQIYFTETADGGKTKTESEWKIGDEVAYRSYLFSFKEGESGNYSVLFQRSKDGKSYTERSYLRLTGAELGSTQYNTFDEAADYNRVEELTSTTGSTTNYAKEYILGFGFFGDATGINAVETTTLDSEPFYTLQGVRVARPTQKGIYIHNGKKILVK